MEEKQKLPKILQDFVDKIEECRKEFNQLNNSKMKVNYKCKENDAELKLICEDGQIDEVWIKIEGKKAWTVIGYKDLMSAVKKAEKMMIKLEPTLV